jgi:undecaprenyl-diphosphatase
MPGEWELGVFHAVNGLAGRSQVLDAVARVFVGDYFVPVVLSLSLFGLWFAARHPIMRERQQRSVMTAVLALIVANLTVLFFNVTEVIVRPRPFEVDAHAAAMATALFYYPPDPTFPSNSMAVAFAMAASAWQGNWRAGLAMGIFGGLMGLSRVYAGVHFPGDVLAGMAIGIGASLVGWTILRVFEPAPSLFLQWARRLYLA